MQLIIIIYYYYKSKNNSTHINNLIKIKLSFFNSWRDRFSTGLNI